MNDRLSIALFLNRFSSDKSEFLKKFRGATSNVDTMANDYVDAEANVGNVDFAGVHNGEWIGTSEQPPENEATRQTGTSMLRERRQFQQSLAASASSSMSAARYYASCEEFCVAHVRQCVRLCLGFSTPLRGLCRTHCKARQRACPRECAGDR